MPNLGLYIILTFVINGVLSFEPVCDCFVNSNVSYFPVIKGTCSLLPSVRSDDFINNCRGLPVVFVSSVVESGVEIGFISACRFLNTRIDMLRHYVNIMDHFSSGTVKCVFHTEVRIVELDPWPEIPMIEILDETHDNVTHSEVAVFVTMQFVFVIVQIGLCCYYNSRVAVLDSNK
jgi:hypothetical protein